MSRVRFVSKDVHSTTRVDVEAVRVTALREDVQVAMTTGSALCRWIARPLVAETNIVGSEASGWNACGVRRFRGGRGPFSGGYVQVMLAE